MTGNIINTQLFSILQPEHIIIWWILREHYSVMEVLSLDMFTQAVTFKFNDSYNQVLYPRFVTVDEQGNINWNPKSDGLSDGTYEFYMFDTSAWGTSKNINELNDADLCYGKMIVTVGSNRDECEFYFDLDKVAQKLGCDVSDFKQISAQFGRLGQEWINTAGASSGAWLGLFICIAGTCGVVVYKKKKGSIQV